MKRGPTSQPRRDTLGRIAEAWHCARMKAFYLLVLAFAACRQEPVPPPTESQSKATKAPTPAQRSSKPASFDLKDDLVDFHFGWSGEAAAVPELVRKLTKDKDKILAELKSGAEEERRERNQNKYGLTFNGFQSSNQYDTAGQSPRLLSLSVATSAYTGGAHANYGMSALLWDRLAKREINFASLFAAPANRDRLLMQRWCDALNRAREEKRGEPVGGSGMFDDCPPLDQIAVIPTDANKNGRFDQLRLVASPYVAGSFAEGTYEVVLTVTPDLMAAIGNEYRSSFEGGQPQ